MMVYSLSILILGGVFFYFCGFILEGGGVFGSGEENKILSDRSI